MAYIKSYIYNLRNMHLFTLDEKSQKVMLDDGHIIKSS